MTRTRMLIALLGALAAASVAPAQVKYPPRADKLDLQIRYRIRADRDERARQFRALDAHLKNLNFVHSPREDADLEILDPTHERFSGTIPSARVLDTLADVRVNTILFAPAGYKFPDTSDKPVSLRIGIATGLSPNDQQRLHGQVVAQLGHMGFREAIGYDHRNYTWVRGDLPYGNLGRLLKDLRREPSGWFLPDGPPELLPPPIRDVLPIRWVEVVPDADLSFLPPQTVPPNRAIFTPDLRAYMDSPASKGRPLKVEVVLDVPADEVQLSRIRARLRVGYTSMQVNPRTTRTEPVTASVEGAVGHTVTVNFPVATDVERLSYEPGVITIRLPRPGLETVAPLAADRQPDSAAAVLAATRLGRIHGLGYRGKGTRIVVIGSDFRGVAELIGKGLPADSRFIDLTAELTPTLEPLPPFTNRVSGGLAAAKAAHLAAPDAHLTLVRVDPTALFQVLGVARFVRGKVEYSEAIQSRTLELSNKADELRHQYLDAVAEYQKAFANPDEGDIAQARRDRARRDLEVITKERELLAVWIDRSIRLQADMKSLDGADVVVNTLVWDTGYRLDGLSDLSQLLDQTFAGDAEQAPLIRSATRPRVVPRPVWVQAASPMVGSVWAGPYLDANQNGVMEFAPPVAPIPVGGWTRELNFFGTRGPDSATLPAGVRVRVTAQWREPHDPAAYAGRGSVFPLTLRVFRQLDPEGKVRASDELLEVARSATGPFRVGKEPTYGVYEQIVEFDVAETGMFGLRVEGVPVFDPGLPALRPHIEIIPRITVEFVGTAPDKGRAVFASYAPRDVGVGIPADAKSVLTLGAAERPDGTGYAGLTGAGPGIALLTKPDLFVDGNLDTGTGLGGSGVSAGFGGGAVAVLVGGGLPPGGLIRATGMKPGGPLVLPEEWLKLIPKR